MNLARPIRALFALCACFALGAPALALELPAGAVRTAETRVAPAEFARAGFNGTEVPLLTLPTEMQVEAWRLPGERRTNYQVLQSLLEQLTEEGYQIVYRCQAVSCGGFDFRFAIGRFAAPELYIDLGSYHYATLRKGQELIGILVSHGGADGFVQISRTAAIETSAAARPDTAIRPIGDLATALVTHGRVVLDDVAFATGSAELADGAEAHLRELASFMTNTPEARIALVGHTDAVGSLENNIALSRKRAQSVRARLISAFGISGDRLLAEGVGFLAPLTSNQTEEGRRANRRVEAVLLNTP